MNKQGCEIILLALIAALLSSCLSGIWTGASLVYDRHNMYKKISDFQLAAAVNKQLFGDRILKQNGCSLDLAIFNGDILLAGHVSSTRLRKIAELRLQRITDYRELYTQISIGQPVTSGLKDAWITTKIRSQIIADAAIDPNAFKIVTIDNIVYVMGDVRPAEAARVLNIAKRATGVIRVVKLLRYYNLSETPDLAG